LEAILQDLSDIASNKAKASADFSQTDTAIGLQGCLLLCRTIETARAMHALYPAFDTVQAPHCDRRASSCIAYRTPLAQIHAPYELIVFCDGQMNPDEAVYTASLFPGAKLRANTRTAELDKALGQLRLTKPELREAYLLLRQGKSAHDLPWHRVKARAAHFVLEELDLVKLDGEQIYLMPMQKINPEVSKLFRLLQ
jgi:hypothetical protein